jgi:hypothetical protein
MTVLPDLDWPRLRRDLDRDGVAVTDVPLLDAATAADLRDGFDDDALFRSTVHMDRHNYGRGTYRYYRDPLPGPVAALREATYPPLAAVANRWAERLRSDERFPDTLGELAERCRRAGQERPTPLVLRYGPGDWNALHQDIYGEVAFPLQLAIALSRPGEDFTGGEHLFVEQRPRSQSRGTALTVPLGHGVVFPTRHRPVKGRQGDHRVTVRHGVSTVRTGKRLVLGIIYHDAT